MRLSALVCAALMLAVCAAAPASSTATPTPASTAHAPANSAPTAAAASAATTANTPLIVPNPPDVDARAYILIDFTTGQVLADHNADARMQPASLTKLMTCYAVFHALKAGTLKLDELVTISEHAWRAEGSRTFVRVGTKVPAEVLIKGMIVQSGNDATIALAERVGGTEPAFVQLMNQYAGRLGMHNTHFDDSSGLPSATHYSTARDLSLLASALVREFPEYYPWFSIKEFVWNNIKQQNRNGLLDRDPSVDGIKTGHTDSAGYCLITSAKRQDMRLIAVVLDSPSIKGRENASAELINFGFTTFETITVRKRGTVVLKPRFYKSSEEYYAVGPAADVTVVVPRGVAGSIETTASVRRPLIAPVSSGTSVGELDIVVDGKLAKSVALYPIANVPQGGIWSRLSDSLILMFQKK